jgi:hypothetical protein
MISPPSFPLANVKLAWYDKSMKKVLKLVPFFFISLLSCIVLGITGFILMNFASMAPFHLSFVLRALKSSLPLSVLVSMLVVMLCWFGLRPNRFLSYLVVAILGFLFLAGGSWFFARIPDTHASSSGSTGITAARIAYAEGIAFYPMGVSHDSVGQTLVADLNRTDSPRLTLYRGGSFDRSKGELRLGKGSDGAPVDIPVGGPAKASDASGDAVFARFLSDAGALNASLYLAASGPIGRYLLFCGAIVILFLSLWFFARLTAWALFNAALAFIAFRLSLAVFSALNDQAFRRIAISVAPFLAVPFAFPAVFAGIGFLLILCDVLLSFLGARRRSEP